MRWSWLATVLVAAAVLRADDDLQDFAFEEPETMLAMESRAHRTLARPPAGVTNSHRPQYELEPSERLTVATPAGAAVQQRRDVLREAVVRALERREHVGKFAQVLPIVRGMSGSQRGALAALVASQVAAPAHRRALTLHQVSSMYGSGANATSELMLPILLDMANLFRRAARPAKLPRSAPPPPAIPHPHALRRSFTDENNSLDDDEGVGEEEQPEDVTTTTITTTLAPTSAPARASRGGVRARGRYADSRSRANRTRAAGAATEAAAPAQQKSTQDNAHSHDDTHSRDTQPRAQTTSSTSSALDVSTMTASPTVTVSSVPAPSARYAGAAPAPNVTLDQAAAAAAAADAVVEDLPVAEKLRGRFHERNSVIKGKPMRRPSWSPAAPSSIRRGEAAAARRRPAAASASASALPGRKTQLSLSGARPVADHIDCELFTNSLCLEARDYPTEAILSSLRRNKAATGALLAEYREQAESGGSVDGVTSQQEAAYTAEQLRADRRGDSAGGATAAGEAGFMCPSTVKYARPQRARATSGNWKYIVNTGEHTQTLRLEKCLKPKESCTYLTDNFKSKCVQVYNYHRLLTWDQQNGLHMDIFKVPTCCSCHIEGYSVAFPPLGHRAHETSSEQFPGQDLSNEASGGVFESALPQPTVIRPSVTKGSTFADRPPDSFLTFPHSNPPAGAAQFSVEEDGSFGGTGPTDSYGNSYFPDSFKQASSSVRQVRKPPRSRQPQYDSEATLPSYLEPPTPSAVSSADFYGSTPEKSKYTTQRKRTKRPSRRPIRKTASGSDVADDLVPSGSALIETQSDIELEEQEPQRAPEIFTIISSTTEAAVPLQSGITRPTQAERGTAILKDISLNKRVNYNYHPIIDFFESSSPSGTGGGGASDRDDSAASLSGDSDWKPMSHPLVRTS